MSASTPEVLPDATVLPPLDPGMLPPAVARLCAAHVALLLATLAACRAKDSLVPPDAIAKIRKASVFDKLYVALERPRFPLRDPMCMFHLNHFDVFFLLSWR